MQLVGLKGIHWTQVFPLTGGEITIGREAGNTIVCDGDSKVSRRHARLIPMGLTYGIEDLGSSNGTLVNGLRIVAPTALNPGDEIVVGGQSFRFEFAAPQQPYAPPSSGPMPPRPKEVSRGEQSGAQPHWNRGTERIYGGPAGDLGGCAMPQFNLPDLSGCVRALIILLIALVVIMILGGLLMLIGAGIGSLGGMVGGAGGSHATSTSGGGSGGSKTSTGGNPGQTPESQPGIHISSVRVAQTWHASLGHSAPRILVSWDNLTTGSVHKITATVTTQDAAGNPLVTTKNVVIYDGQPIQGGESHEDKDSGADGFDPPAGGNPAKATVEVTNYE